jgi:hypothetical protein
VAAAAVADLVAAAAMVDRRAVVDIVAKPCAYQSCTHITLNFSII